MTQIVDAGPANADKSFVAGMSPSVSSVMAVIAEIAPTNIPILLVGESGTGKQMFAQLIHRLSAKSEDSFVKVACAAMNPARIAANSVWTGPVIHRRWERCFLMKSLSWMPHVSGVCYMHCRKKIRHGHPGDSRRE